MRKDIGGEAYDYEDYAGLIEEEELWRYLQERELEEYLEEKAQALREEHYKEKLHGLDK